MHGLRAKIYAVALLDEYIHRFSLQGWKQSHTRIPSDHGSLATTFEKHKAIQLNPLLFTYNFTKEELLDTILHEIAHAIDVQQRETSDHSKIWYDIFHQIGGKTDATINLLPRHTSHRKLHISKRWLA